MRPEELVEFWNKHDDQDGSSRDEVLNAEDYFDGWEVVEGGEWTQDLKYQHIERVIKHTESGRCFSVSAGRSGSYHTDWYYTYDDLTEVKAVTKTIKVTEWVAV